MKKYFLLFLILFFAIISCDKNDDIISIYDEPILKKADKDKVSIYHYNEDLDRYIIIGISSKALEEHLA